MLPFYQKNQDIRVGRGQNLHFPPHLHKSLEMLLVARGPCRMEIQGIQYVLETGDLAIIFPNQVHAYLGSEQHYILICSLEYCGGFIPALTMNRPLTPILRAADVHPNIHYAFNELHHCTDIPTAPEVKQALVQLILARSLSMFGTRKTDHSHSEELAERLLQFISEHFREPLSLDILASHLHLSRYYLSHLFSEKIGMTFTRYVQEFRLDYAASAIRSTGKPLTEIWLEAGFDSQRTFNRAFRSRFGMTPSEYRKNK